MKLALSILGAGAVSPGGVGVAALENAPRAEAAPFVGRPGETWPAFRVAMNDSALERWRGEPRLRRASPIGFHLVEAAAQCVAGLSPEERRETGLVAAFSTGSLVYSRRFYAAVAAQGRAAASPALFPETVFNSPASHVAAALGLGGPSYALVGDETSWIAALQVAALWLAEGTPRVVVLGAEEFDPIILDAYRAAGWLKKGSPFIPSEGAGGLLVGPAQSGHGPVIAAARDGLPYRTPRQARAAAERILAGEEKIVFLPSAQRNWMQPIEAAALAGRPTVDSGPYLGEAQAASAAWNTVRGLGRLAAHSRLLQPVWGLNHQIGSLELAGSCNG